MFSEELGEWTAAQIIGFDEHTRTVDVLDLDWSGPEPAMVADLVRVKPLRGIGFACGREWVLPRSHTIIGNAPLLRPQPSGRFGSGWDTGRALYEHRARSADKHWKDPRSDQLGETGLHRHLADPNFRDPELLHLDLTPGPVSGPEVDCNRMVQAYPNLVSLTVYGVMGSLKHADAINRLGKLRRLDLTEVFGMTAREAPDPTRLTRLEHIRLDSVPADYAEATRRAWRPLIPEGVLLEVTKARRPEWVAQNQANPLRGWDGRDGITSVAYAKARAAWNQSTPPILTALTEDMPEQARLDRLATLGANFAEAFNDADRRSGFILTDERDELLQGLADLLGSAPVAPELDRVEALNILLHAVNQARDW